MRWSPPGAPDAPAYDSITASHSFLDAGEAFLVRENSLLLSPFPDACSTKQGHSPLGQKARASRTGLRISLGLQGKDPQL